MARSIACVLVCCGVSASALGQFDDSPWPGFKGAPACRGSVLAPGPAVNLAFELNELGTISPGGITLGANGDIYFKTYRTAGSHAFRLDKETGCVLAKSVDLGGALGNYAGIAVGKDYVYTCHFTAAFDTSIYKLDKETLEVVDQFANAVTFQGLRGTPLIGSVENDQGNVNLYVHDRNGSTIHCVDSEDGGVKWTHPVVYPSTVGMMGPMWLTGDGRQAFAFFGRHERG